MISAILSRLVILVFGTLYPAYSSYKAVRTKNVKEYVKWMMYWIVFALFTCAETFTDVFLSWFPFYYEIKIILVVWLLSPATKGSSILYRKFVHPTLSSREQEIDEYINKAKEQSYRQVLDIGSKGVSAIMQTAIKTITQFPSTLALVNPDHIPQHPPTADDQTDATLKHRHSADDLINMDFSEESGDEYYPEEKPKAKKEKAPPKKKEKNKVSGTRKSSRKAKEVKSETDLYGFSD